MQLARPTVESMSRSIAITTLAGVVGSILATLAFVVVEGGAGAEPNQFIVGWSLGTMLFTIPGAFLLLVFQNLVVIQRPATAAVAVLLLGATAGALILAVPAQTFTAVVLGAFYGFTTAGALLILQQLLVSKPKIKS